MQAAVRLYGISSFVYIKYFKIHIFLQVHGKFLEWYKRNYSISGSIRGRGNFSFILYPFCCLTRELPDVQAGFRKGRGTRDQIANTHWIIEKARSFQKNIYFCFIDYTKAFDRVDHNKLWKILKEMRIADYLTCLLRNLYAGQETTVRTWHGTTD